MAFALLWGLSVIRISDQSYWRCLLELLPSKNPKMGPNGSWTKKKRSYFFWVKSITAITKKMKLGIEIELMNSPVIGYVRISDEPLAWSHVGNLDLIWVPQKKFFHLMLQEFLDFSGTWEFHYLIFLIMLLLQFLAMFLVFRRWLGLLNGPRL